MAVSLGRPEEGPGRAALPNLDALYTARVRQGVGAALADVRGSVVFDNRPVGQWSLLLDEGRITLRRGTVARPTSLVRTDPQTMAEVLEGRRSGVEAFLAGELVVRGNLALALQVDGAFDVGVRPPEAPRARVVDVLGARTGYLEAGPPDAPPVILLHGLGATNASMLPLLADLARDHRVLAPDTMGFGSSAAPRWRYTVDELAQWLRAFQVLVDAQPAALVGNSLGGRLAIEAGLTAPRSVRRMVLLCPSPAFRRLRQFVPVVHLLSPGWARAPMWFHHRLVVQSIRAMFAQPDRLPGEWYDAAADEFRRVMTRADYRRSFFACLKQIYVEDAYGERGFWDRLPTLRVPTMFVWGQRDRLVPHRFARHVARALPTAASVVLDDCGHVPQFELPEQTNALVRDFLD